jgi:hypothetical protein
MGGKKGSIAIKAASKVYIDTYICIYIYMYIYTGKSFDTANSIAWKTVNKFLYLYASTYIYIYV